jgi:hypothetical protein
MYQFKDCSPVQIRWIHIYLYILRQFNESNSKIKLDQISFENLKAASRDLSVKKKALELIEKKRANKVILKSDYIFLDLLLKSANKEFNKLEILKSKHGFEKVIDNDFIDGICDNEKLVISEVEKGLEVIKRISSIWYKNMVDVLENISGIYDERNIINSGFTKDFPGFINLNINADPLIIGEQLAHETTHLVFENHLYFTNDTKEYIKSIPPIYSIFAKKPRSAELVLHGLYSYTSVYIYWDKLTTLFPLDKRIEKRKKQVQIYIDAAINDLNNVLKPNDWVRIKNIYKKICPIFDHNIWNSTIQKKVITDKTISRLGKYLNDIEIAEVLLAIEGNKVSRISKPINCIKDLMKIIHELPVYYCFSNYIFTSKSDNKINDFQNIISSIYNLDTHINDNLDIHIYFSKNKNNLINSFILDQKDESATLFETPKCCQTFFNKHWDAAVKKYNGDLTMLYFKNGKKTLLTDNLQYNPIGMYFGLGFCWHFPCSLDCSNTKKIINARMQILKKYKLIFNRLSRINNYNLEYDPQKGYSLLKIK